MEVDYKKLVRERILARDGLIRATFSGGQKGSSLAWNKVIVRPVEIKGEIHLQFSYFDDKKDITKNHLADAASKVDELLALPFRNIFVESADGNVQVNISKRGKAVVSEPKSSKTHVETNLAHDRQKSRLLSADNAEPFLKAVGIMTSDGRIRADMQRKFKQINEFLRLVDETDSFRPGSTQAFQTLSSEPIHVVDFGCGNAYLTFAIYYYLNEILKFDARVTGVDVKADLIASHQQKAESLGWSRINFHVGEIEGYIPEHKPNVVLALHACDTATDDALAQGIRWGSKLIVCAPCCQHELQAQMSRVAMPEQLLPIFKDGIFFERMGDILTDTFRAAILRIMGYRTDVTQFVPIEHTAKNLMIRSVKTSPAGNAHWIEEYRNLKSFWQVTPYLEKLLGDEYKQFL
ncbi:MAG: SAM-dependent methyltransferase [Anaerolineae bacterium]|nr:SAM-dependent methyltransferase [Anaerolineae bacterium]MBL8104765.1 SAM-dependent methyltransferase [Anaerolineales bacterium]MCC7187229.1 SAM-dependent methyltransferase [Anaerolineales bacterium]